MLQRRRVHDPGLPVILCPLLLAHDTRPYPSCGDLGRRFTQSVGRMARPDTPAGKRRQYYVISVARDARHQAGPPRAGASFVRQVSLMGSPRWEGKSTLFSYQADLRVAAVRGDARSCRVSCAYSSRIGPCILLVSPQLDQDLEQRPVSLQRTDDGFKIGPRVMPVNSVTLSGGHGYTAGRTRAGPFRAGSGNSALARQGTQMALYALGVPFGSGQGSSDSTRTDG